MSSKQEIKTCIDRVVTDAGAAQLALEENPANAPAIDPRMLPPGVMVAAMAALTGKLWKPGRELRVRFLDGDPRVQQRLQPFVHEWSKHCDIKFVFGDDPNAEIRISFKDKGSWSYIGTDCLSIPKNRATMNYGWLTPTAPDEEYSRVVIHEFGHALGCIHEHQNPSTAIPWDKPKVYAYYAGPPNNWTKDQVDINLFQTYSRDITQYSQFDPKSIMLYPIPNDFTIGDFEVGWNRVLSDVDKEFIGILYPAQPKTGQALAIDGGAVKASIGQFGETDTFTFNVSKAGRYRVETLGGLDLVMSLFGPDNPTQFVATDDDSGLGLNPRIIRFLRAGVYTIRVRHFNNKKTGDYELKVSTEQ
jgi:hypothetical protein